MVSVPKVIPYLLQTTFSMEALSVVYIIKSVPRLLADIEVLS